MTPFYKQWLTAPPRIEKGLDIKLYHESSTHISSSWLKAANKSMYNFFMYPNKPKKEVKAFKDGGMVHKYLLEREDFEKEYVLIKQSDFPFPEQTMAKKENKAFIESQDRIVVTEEEWNFVVNVCARASQDKFFTKVLNGGNVEDSFFWNCDETGLPLKTRPDLWKKGKSGVIVIDPKTTQDISEFTKSVCNLDYPLQAAIQCDGIRACTGMDVSAYLYLAIEKEYPYDYCLYRLSEDDIEVGRRKYIHLLYKIKEAIESGNIPSYGQQYGDFTSGVVDLTLPSWYYSK